MTRWVGPCVMSEAHYDLGKVKAEVETCCFPAPKKSIDAVMAVFRNKGNPLTKTKAKEFIRNEIMRLTNEDFFETTLVWGTDKADVYGKEINDITWYIKFVLDENDGLCQISFHPAEYEIKLKNGKVLKEGGWVYEEKLKMWRVR